MMINENDYEKAILEYNYSARDKFIDNQYDQCKQFDQSMFIISSGLFGITFTFINDIVEALSKTPTSGIFQP